MSTAAVMNDGKLVQCASADQHGHGAWNDRSIGSAKTFDEARRVAEADHARRTEQTASDGE